MFNFFFQIIEALAYPCYKVGCGKMLTIKDIHSHELQCNFQEDKDMKYNKNMIQSQNILKHLEDHYSSFYLKPGDDVSAKSILTLSIKIDFIVFSRKCYCIENIFQYQI